MRTAKKTAAKQGICEELSRLQVEFEQWRAARATGTTGRRIPPELWAGAVGVATRHGVRQVAGVLHLEYAGLKRRVELAGGGQQPAEQQSSEPQFVELFALVTSGQIKVDVARRYPLEEAAQAHRDLESRATTGSTHVPVTLYS